MPRTSKVPPSAEVFAQTIPGGRALAAWGDGDLESRGCPVLVMLHEHTPFPGFGRHQARELFVCRPDGDKGPPDLDSQALNDAVSEALTGMIRNAGLSCVSSGQVVLIDGDTLRTDSPWLDLEGQGRRNGPDRAPPLFLPPQKAAAARSIDERASVRTYTCIQAVVPEYLMCVTFFVRTFLAGNSAACEVNVTTLGPPANGWDHIRNRLRVYDRESERKLGGKPDPAEAEPQVSRASALGQRLQAVGFVLDNYSRVFKSPQPLEDLMDLEPFDPLALRHEARQAERIAGSSEVWPGIYTALVNWREQHSVTFTTDFFGNTESRAVLKTLFDRICRSALSRLKELGFDISDYQDESGRFAINAHSIEQLVVGERVYMEKKPKAAAGQDGGGQAPEQGKA